MKSTTHSVTLSNNTHHITCSNNRPFMLMAGPCLLESVDHGVQMAGQLTELCGRLGIPFVYKTSLDKANRSSIHSNRGLGFNKALKALADIKAQAGCLVVTDVHESAQCADVGEVADILQIPAFLCRQTDLLVAAAQTGCVINVKKGQFLAPWDMTHVAKKLEEAGAAGIMLCDRGTSFGYNTLVSDMRGIPILKSLGHPVVFDATHSVQQPGGMGATSGGQRQFVPVLARAAVSLGIGALFIETHENPEAAPSDGPNMVPFSELEALLCDLAAFDALAKSRPLTPCSV